MIVKKFVLPKKSQCMSPNVKAIYMLFLWRWKNINILYEADCEQLAFPVVLAALCRLDLFLESSFHSDVVCVLLVLCLC